MLSNFFAVDTPYKQLRLDCVSALKKIYEEMNSWDSATSPLRLGELARTHLILYGELGRQQIEENLWCFAPKHHLFIHCAESTRVNPKQEWCYSDEDEIGKCAALARSCNPLYISSHLVMKYRETFQE